MTAKEVKPFIDEAIDWARKIDAKMISLLLAADGRITVASGGSADTYVARIKEGLAIENKSTDLGRTAALNALLCHAYWLAGLLNKSLAANDAAMQGVASIEKFDEQFMGLNVEQWMQSLRGRLLVRLGRFDEAEHCLHKIMTIEQSLLDPAVQFIPHFAYVDLAYFRGDATLAETHALHIARIAEKGHSPYLQVYALGCLGVAKSLAMDFAGGVRALTEGVRYAQTAKAALEFEAEMMANLADCHYRLGDLGQAAAIAQEAIDVARQRGARLAECRACITRGAVLLAEGNAIEIIAADALFGRARTLIDISGAIVFEPLLAQERARMSTSE